MPCMQEPHRRHKTHGNCGLGPPAQQLSDRRVHLHAVIPSSPSPRLGADFDLQSPYHVTEQTLYRPAPIEKKRKRRQVWPMSAVSRRLRSCGGREFNACTTLGLWPRLGPITRFVNDILKAYDNYGD